LQRLLGHAKSFIDKRSSGVDAVSMRQDIPGAVAQMSLDELRDEVVKLSSQVGSRGGGGGGSGGGVDEESRQRLEQQVLTELASHPTVTYVRALEEEREGYRDALQVTTCF
jgi:hypothetical protein